MAGSASSSTQQTTTTNIDKRVSTGSGDILALADNTVNGGSISITTADAAVAQSAISAAKDLAQNSNAIASQVAESQSQFVEAASGQKTTLYVVGGLALAMVLVIALIFRRKA